MKLIKNKHLFLFLILFKSNLFSQNIVQEEIRNLIKEGNIHEAILRIEDIEKKEKLTQTLIELKGKLYVIIGNTDEACKYFNKLKTTYLNKIIYYNFGCNKNKQYNYFIKKNYPDVKNFRQDHRPVYTRKDSLRGSLNEYRNCYDIVFYDLYVKIIPLIRTIKGKNEITFKTLKTTDVIQVDLQKNLEIEAILWKNKKLKYSREYDAVFINFPEKLNENDIHKILIIYKGKPIKAKNPPWEGGFVWKKDEENKLFVGVACEYLGASSWWPVKDYLGDEPDSMQINIEVPSNYYAISNGQLIDTQKNKGNVIYKYKIHYPINNYNVTFYMGKYLVTYDTLNSNNQKILLKYYTLPYNKDKFTNYFKQSKIVLNTFIKIFGDYPFILDGYGLVESPYSGMEHQTVIAYGNKIIQHYNNNNDKIVNYDQIIIHETAHEWWGNAISASDMADIWLHEGFATFSELLFYENVSNKKDYLKELIKIINYIYNLWPVVGNYEVNENTFITNDVYNKGAVILHNLRCIINDDKVFYNMLKQFYQTFKYKTINTDTFKNFVNRFSGKNLNAYFKKFLYQTDIPQLKYKFKVINDTLNLYYQWNNVEEGFQMPFSIFTDNGKIIRINASSDLNLIKIPGCRFFYFINQYTIQPFLSKEQIEDEIFYGFTYYKTLWEK